MVKVVWELLPVKKSLPPACPPRATSIVAPRRHVTTTPLPDRGNYTAQIDRESRGGEEAGKKRVRGRERGSKMKGREENKGGDEKQ